MMVGKQNGKARRTFIFLDRCNYTLRCFETSPIHGNQNAVKSGTEILSVIKEIYQVGEKQGTPSPVYKRRCVEWCVRKWNHTNKSMYTQCAQSVSHGGVFAWRSPLALTNCAQLVPFDTLQMFVLETQIKHLVHDFSVCCIVWDGEIWTGLHRNLSRRTDPFSTTPSANKCFLCWALSTPTLFAYFMPFSKHQQTQYRTRKNWTWEMW